MRERMQAAWAARDAQASEATQATQATGGVNAYSSPVNRSSLRAQGVNPSKGTQMVDKIPSDVNPSSVFPPSVRTRGLGQRWRWRRPTPRLWDGDSSFLAHAREEERGGLDGQESDSLLAYLDRL